MTTKRVHTALLAEFAEFMGIQMGLSFPKERWLDLLKGLQAASREFGFSDPEACIRWLMSSPLKKHHIETLACQFTVGETYFFREPKVFDILEKHLIPEILRTRRESDRRLRVWSAGCCTGEEAYSLAILLSRIVPDLHRWNVSILATDINPVFLNRAMQGVYREWSFRGTPYWLKENYFRVTSDGNHEILPQIKKMVKFQYLNLVEDAYPSLFNDTNAMDIVFCRNVLMYFTQEHMTKSIARFNQCLLDKGWLVVGSSETSHVFFPQFTACNFPGAILYHKHPSGNRRFRDYVNREGDVVRPEAAEPAPPAFRRLAEAAPPARVRPRHVFRPEPAVPVMEPAVAPEENGAYEEALSLYESGAYEAVIEKTGRLTPADGGDARLMTLAAKSYANQGRLSDAIAWCDKALASEKMNPHFHHLRAVILQEQGEREEAMTSLKRALYLDSNFVLAHFLLGNLSEQAGKIRESRKYFENALALLGGYAQDDLLDASDGLTAGRLKELIHLMLNREMNA